MSGSSLEQHINIAAREKAKLETVFTQMIKELEFKKGRRRGDDKLKDVIHEIDKEINLYQKILDIFNQANKSDVKSLYENILRFYNEKNYYYSPLFEKINLLNSFINRQNARDLAESKDDKSREQIENRINQGEIVGKIFIRDVQPSLKEFMNSVNTIVFHDEAAASINLVTRSARTGDDQSHLKGFKRLSESIGFFIRFDVGINTLSFNSVEMIDHVYKKLSYIGYDKHSLLSLTKSSDKKSAERVISEMIKSSVYEYCTENKTPDKEKIAQEEIDLSILDYTIPYYSLNSAVLRRSAKDTVFNFLIKVSPIAREKYIDQALEENEDILREEITLPHKRFLFHESKSRIHTLCDISDILADHLKTMRDSIIKAIQMDPEKGVKYKILIDAFDKSKPFLKTYKKCIDISNYSINMEFSEFRGTIKNYITPVFAKELLDTMKNTRSVWIGVASFFKRLTNVERRENFSNEFLTNFYNVDLTDYLINRIDYFEREVKNLLD